MNKKTVRLAVAEARRFISRADAVLDKDFQPNAERSYFFPSQETAALRRASMDLTRALAEMRKF